VPFGGAGDKIQHLPYVRGDTIQGVGPSNIRLRMIMLQL